MFRQTEGDRDTLTVEERDAKISAFSCYITNPDVCLGGFKGWIRKSRRGKQMMDEDENSGNENKSSLSHFLKGLRINVTLNSKCEKVKVLYLVTFVAV